MQDEHWKTANSALERIRKGFQEKQQKLCNFFVAAAIEKAMAAEIHTQLEEGTMTNAANLTSENQIISLCRWLIHI